MLAFFFIHLKLLEYRVSTPKRYIHPPDLLVKSTPPHTISDIKAFDPILLRKDDKSLHSTVCSLIQSVGLFVSVLVALVSASVTAQATSKEYN